MYEQFTARNTVVIAVSQEDTELAKHARFLKAFKSNPPFNIVADLNRAVTKKYHPTTAYLIDKQGVVRQVFPMMVHHRAPWGAILTEMDRLGVGK